MTNRRDIFDEGFLARLQRLALIAKQRADRGPGLTQRSARLGDGLEFADHRDYAAGDDVRFVDWPYYARMEKLLLRLFHQHSDARVAVLLDVSASMAPSGGAEKFRHALRAAAALAYVAVASLRRVTIQPFADALGPPLHAGRRSDQFVPVLDFLASLEPGGKTDFPLCAKRLAGTLEAGAAVLILSDLLGFGGGLDDGLARLAFARCDLTVLHVYSPAEARPDLAGPVLLAQGEDGRQLGLQVTQAVLQEYGRQWDSFLARCRRHCLARGAVYVPVPCDLSLERLVLGCLRRAGVLAG